MTAQPLDNARHEAFAQRVASGLSLTDAYAETYPDAQRDTAKTAGSVLAARPEVAARIQALQAPAAAEAGITLQELLRELRGIVQDARADKDHATAGANVERLAKLAGLYSERQPVINNNNAPTYVVQGAGEELDEDAWDERHRPN